MLGLYITILACVDIVVLLLLNYLLDTFIEEGFLTIDH